VYEANFSRPAGRRALVALVPGMQGTPADMKASSITRRAAAQVLRHTEREVQRHPG